MNNVVNFKPRQRLDFRSWAYHAAAGTTAGACGYLVLVSFWPEVFASWLGGLMVASAVLVANAIAAGFYAQKVRLQRELRNARAAHRRQARAREAARARAAMDAPTQVLQFLQPRQMVSQTTYRPEGGGLDDRLRMKLWDDLTERTGDIGSLPRPTPPHGWRTGAA